MSAKTITAKVRPLANQSLEKASLLGAARVYVSKDSLIALTGGLDHGKRCLVTPAESAEDSSGGPREALLWTLPEKNLSPNVAMMTRAFQEAAGLKIGDSVQITVAGAVPEAEEVVVQDVTVKGEKGEKSDKADEKGPLKYPVSWEPALQFPLDRAEHVFPGMVLEGVSVSSLRRSFKVLSVNSLPNSVAKYAISSTQIRIVDPEKEAAAAAAPPAGDLVVSGVSGYPGQVEALNRFLGGFGRPFLVKNERVSCGVMIHGKRGSGKTHLLKRIAETNWGRVHWIKPSAKVSAIRETFGLAHSQKPSIVLIDGLNALIDSSRTTRESVIQILCEELDGLSSAAEAAGALPDVVVVATCNDYMADVPEELQKLERFYENITLHIPKTQGRLDILKSLDIPVKPEEKDACLLSLAEWTHAYNPGDLVKVVALAKASLGNQLCKAGVDPTSGEEHFLSTPDLRRAMTMTRPTAMHDINLNPPIIHWQDIGGQEGVKRSLSLMIKYAKNPELSLRPPPKGLLLYGPPGCSKTLSAQAAATESGFNFFAVKGAELLNMYVGESERAIRNLFERARQASPSIIFFDEIDAIGGQRSGSGSGASRSTGAVNMLTSLLTEMDGFEALVGVFVLAATNRPEAIDPALMRPGRFDQALYVGLPDLAAREAVFRVHLRDLPLSEDVDIPHLAGLADGHSGAEIRAVCDKACFTVQDRHYDNPEAQKLELTMADLKEALTQVPRNVTKQMIEGYEKWLKRFEKA